MPLCTPGKSPARGFICGSTSVVCPDSGGEGIDLERQGLDSPQEARAAECMPRPLDPSRRPMSSLSGIWMYVASTSECCWVRSSR